MKGMDDILGLQRFLVLRGGKGWRGEPEESGRGLSDELRSALARPAPGADPQGAPEGGAGGEQKVERAAEEEKILPANAEETHGLQGWHQEPLTKSSRRHPLVVAECLEGVLAAGDHPGGRLKRWHADQACLQFVAATTQRGGKKLNEQGATSRGNSSRSKRCRGQPKKGEEVSRSLAMLMDAIKIFEKAVLGPVDSDGSLSPQPPTVRK